MPDEGSISGSIVYEADTLLTELQCPNIYLHADYYKQSFSIIPVFLCVFFCVFFLLFVHVVLVISRFGFEGWIWVLIASVPDLCILFTLNHFFFCLK